MVKLSVVTWALCDLDVYDRDTYQAVILHVVFEYMCVCVCVFYMRCKALQIILLMLIEQLYARHYLKSQSSYM